MNEKDDTSPNSTEKIREEYNQAAASQGEHEMVKWGSSDSMINRFGLAMDRINFDAISSWLDVGCGTGAFQQLVFSELDEPPKTVGIDLSEDLISFAEKQVEQERCEFRRQDFLSVTDRDLNLVTAIGVLQKTNMDVDTFFRRSWESLQPGGLIFVTTKHLGWEKFERPDFTPESNHRWFYVSDIVGPAESVGFDVTEVSGFLPRENRVVRTEQTHTIFLLARKDV